MPETPQDGRRRRFGKRASTWRVWSAPQGPLRVVRVLRRANHRQALQLVADRKAQWAHLESGECLGVQLLRGNEPVAKQQAVRESEPSSAALTAGEMDLVAGTEFRDGKSRTAKLTDAQRDRRVQLGCEEMDGVEKAQRRLEAWNPARGRAGVRSRRV